MNTKTRAVGIGTIIVAILAVGALVGIPALVGEAAPRMPFIGEAPIGADDGVIEESAQLTIEMDGPALDQLDPELRAAVQAASDAAAVDGQPLYIVSGWRSARYQQRLFDDAIVLYASEEIARQFVAPPELSAHVSGDAVDIGPLDAQLWLQQYGHQFGLCQTYANERWHYELATEPGGACPEMLLDASELG